MHDLLRLLKLGVCPRDGWLLFTEWMLFTFTGLYGAFLWLAFHAGRGSEGPPAVHRTPSKLAPGHRYAAPWPPTLMCGASPLPPHWTSLCLACH